MGCHTISEHDISAAMIVTYKSKFSSVPSPVPSLVSVSDTKEETHTCNDPLCWLLLGLEVEGPHIGGASHSGLVDRTLVHVLGVLLVDGNCLDEDDGQGGGKLLQP